MVYFNIDIVKEKFGQPDTPHGYSQVYVNQFLTEKQQELLWNHIKTLTLFHKVEGDFLIPIIQPYTLYDFLEKIYGTEEKEEKEE